MYTHNHLFFPQRAIAALRHERGQEWQALVLRVQALPPGHEDVLAFMWMMVRLNGCAACETDSFRALRGCATCAVQTLRRFKGSDADLLAAYDQALADLRRFSETDSRFVQIMGSASVTRANVAQGAVNCQTNA